MVQMHPLRQWGTRLKRRRFDNINALTFVSSCDAANIAYIPSSK